MKLGEDFMRQLLATFAVEAQEHAHTIGRHLLALEKAAAPEPAAAALNEIFRAAHSLKGAARAVNQDAIGTLAHHLETLFGRLKSGELARGPEVFDLAYLALDGLNTLVGAGPEGGAAVDVTALVELLETVGHERASLPPMPAALTPMPAPAPVPATEPKTNGAHLPEAKAAPEPRPEASRPRASDDTIRVATDKLDALLAEVAELQVARLGADQRLAELRALVETVETWETDERQARQALRARPAPNSSAPLEAEANPWLAAAEKHGEQVRRTRVRLDDLRRHLEADNRRMAQLLTDLQDDVRRTRLLPIATLFDIFPRVVRDLARQLDKEAELVVHGGETEVDRAVLEQVKDPLLHLLRNSLDHGLETPAAREAAGKPRAGTLTLTASQTGNRIHLELADDGAGINVRQVREGAVRHGLLTAEAAAALSDREALWLIFRSGLSTRREVTDLSGRGVGLDVVRENIERLNGSVDVASVPGQGTRFGLSLPLTVATTMCLLAQSGGQTFAVPMSKVVRIVGVGPDEIGLAEGREVIRVEDQAVALARLDEVLGLPAQPEADPAGRRPVIIIGAPDWRAGFLVDAVQDAKELIIKRLPEPLRHVRHIAGASLLGTGDVVMILNAAELLGSTGRSAARQPAAAPAATARPRILVADDSITTRTLEKNILEAAGYEVRAAADGQEAWSRLQEESFSLLVSDVDMPRLDGCGLTEKIRADEKLKNLPVILVTSRDSKEDRERGVRAGADAYIIKGAFDQDALLSAVRQLI
jgi:two-component system chemotaxis sensor kinase CheA